MPGDSHMGFSDAVVDGDIVLVRRAFCFIHTMTT
jgi:hypothetical protein